MEVLGVENVPVCFLDLILACCGRDAQGIVQLGVGYHIKSLRSRRR